MTDAEPSRSILESLSRNALASARHRAAIGRLLRLSENEALAIVHLRREGPLTPTALGRLLSLTSGGTTALLQRLERAGHLVRDRHPADGRSTLVRLSAATERRAQEAVAPLAGELEARVSELSEADRATVREFLCDVARMTEEHADRAERTAYDLERIVIDRPVPSASG